MILGLYYLSTVLEGVKGQGRVFSSLEEAEMALDRHEIDMQAKVLIRLPESFVLPKNWEPGEVKVLDPREGEDEVVKEERFHDGTVLFATSYGRILFNETLPTDYPFVNEQVAKGRLSKIVDDIAMRYSTQQVAATLDALKDLGFTRAQMCIRDRLRTGLSRMERVVRERMTTQDAEAITPQSLINIRPVNATIKEFFGTSQLSQFMDQNNPLSGVTNKRRLSALGPGGLSRDRASMEVRDVHPSHFGRMLSLIHI